MMPRESFFDQLFGYCGAQLQDPSTWLTLTAADGQTIPYVGCVEMDVQLSKCGIIIVKDRCLPRVPGLLSVNVIHSCWQSLFQDQMTIEGTPAFQANSMRQKAWKQALTFCSQEAHFADPDGVVGYVRVQKNVHIPPKQEVLFVGRVRVDGTLGPNTHHGWLLELL
ncbi:UNVERIFIED_CONTAM: hypothetical protein FKN15_002385 [Acipenser sinensis]